MNQSRPTTYAALEWQARKTFVRIISDICSKEQIELAWLSDHWIAKLKRGSSTCYIHAYTFPLNNAATAAIMRDKVATYQVLHNNNIPAIPHHLFRLPAGRDVADAAGHMQKLAPLPLVVKPNVSESGGADVFKCMTPGDLAKAAQELAGRYQTIAVSPFTDIAAEYRVVMFNNEPKVVFEKIRSQGQWQHNLKLGAVPALVTDTSLRGTLASLARQAIQAVQGRIASVDIVAVPEGYKILEINGGITLNLFSDYSPEFEHLATTIYTELITASLQR